jgi:Flp pilus assembly protein TadD
MLRTLTLSAAIAILASWGLQEAWARDGVTITIPRRSELTPVQQLNREGVAAVKKHQYEKAEQLFYKAYLYDPADPFTLNNLGYIAEMQGQLDRARKFYELASEQGSDADIDVSNVSALEGKPMKAALESLQYLPMKVNRMNVNAMQFLSQGRGFEAVSLLRQGLDLDPQNPFTLNNLGVAEEAAGDYESAMRYYSAAAGTQSMESVVLTPDHVWRGKSVSEMARSSAERLEQAEIGNPANEKAAMFSLRGVFAENENDWETARQDFLQAYALDPSSAFSLNNRGYVAEMDGDLETAQFFYEKALRADDASARVGLSTKRSAEGKSLLSVAIDSDGKVDAELDKYSEERHRQTGPVELIPRGGTPAPGSETTPEQQPSSIAPPAPPPLPAPQLQ